MGTSNTPRTVLGAWRIVEMELWDGEAVDLMGPALIEFGRDQTGQFRFIAVEGSMDCRHEQRDGRPHVEFSWEGDDDGDPAHGRGWGTLANDGSLQGRVYFHMGDDSGFRAVRADERSGSNAGTCAGSDRPSGIRSRPVRETSLEVTDPPAAATRSSWR